MDLSYTVKITALLSAPLLVLSDFCYLRKARPTEGSLSQNASSRGFVRMSSHYPGVKDPFTILRPEPWQNSFFRFMVYFQKAEIQHTRLCGFFRWQRARATATIDTLRDQIALREKYGCYRGVLHAIFT